jgi:tRNA dimethylallyltransferase
MTRFQLQARKLQWRDAAVFALMQTCLARFASLRHSRGASVKILLGNVNKTEDHVIQTNQNSAILIAGPTASGKSALALKLARERDGVIINADSMQVYRPLRILSARPSVEDEAQAPHRLYGHVGGEENYSAGRWLSETKLEMQACWSIGRLPIVVGGTGLYFMALQGGLADVPAIPTDLRDKWRGFTGDLHAELQKRDPIGAAKLNPADIQRIIRALEVVDATGKPLAVWQDEARGGSFLNAINVERLFLDVPREELYARSERRFDMMMEQGALDEVRALPVLSPDYPMMKAIGVPELSANLRDELSLDEAVIKAKTATRQYIKRQLTWWRGQMTGWQTVQGQ